MIITHVGPYSIGQNIKDIKDTQEYSQEEYDNFAAAGSPRTSQGEQFYRGKKVSFAGIEDWDITIGVINGLIYKFGLVKIAVWKSMSKDSYTTTKSYIMNIYHKPSKSSFLSKEVVWTQPDGNITLNIRSALLPEATKKVSGVVVDITSGEVMQQLNIS